MACQFSTIFLLTWATQRRTTPSNHNTYDAFYAAVDIMQCSNCCVYVVMFLSGGGSGMKQHASSQRPTFNLLYSRKADGNITFKN